MNRLHWQAEVLVSSIVSALLYVQPIAAQVIPDDTLPAGERSQVTGDINARIDGGARRGGNLFHSFQSFSVPTGGSAHFNNALDVENIFSRVTGSSASNIDGLIRANGTANLFLLNPNGILFGPNASLNIGGSFVATTADAIGFPNGEVFSSDATQALPSQLLNVNANALFFNQLAAQPIINQSTANNRTGLRVPGGQSLLLVGGDVRLEGGQITSPGSRVELGAVAEQGIVRLSETAGEWRLSFSAGVARADVVLNNRAGINVRAGGGGSIAVTARNVDMSGGSVLNAGISRGLGFAGAQAGDVQIDATEAITIADSSGIGNTVAIQGRGSSGNINITTGSLALSRFSSLSNDLYGQGNAGNITIQARDTVSLDSSFLNISVDERGIGNAGNINITTGSLSLAVGSQVNSFTGGQGNAGSVNIQARDTVALDYDSVMFNNVFSSATGNSGGINITTGSLLLSRYSTLLSSTGGRGNAGSVNIQARDTVSLDGTRGRSEISTQVDERASGQGGDVTITAGSLFLTNGGIVSTRNSGGIGNAGGVRIQARDTVQILGGIPGTGSGSSRVVTSATTSRSVDNQAVGDGGDVTITTGSLSVANTGRIATNVSGQGNAGNIRIQARDTVLFDDGDAISTLGQRAVGRGGDIAIEARSLTLLNGAQLSTSTRGQGNAGDVTVDVRDTVSLAGASRTSPSAINTQVETGAIGNGGQINITTGSISLADGAQLVTTTSSRGRAGDISINARDRVVISGSDPNYANRSPLADVEASVINVGSTSGLYTNTGHSSTGRGGHIRVITEELTVEQGGRVVASTAGQGDAGNIQVRAAERVRLSGTSLDGFSSGLLTNTEATATGEGGRIRVTTPSLQVSDGAVLSARSSSVERSGGIVVNADTVDLTRGGQLLTTASSRGDAGAITVNARDRVRILGSDSSFEARLAQFGRPTVDPVSAASGLFTNTEAGSSGAGGAIALTTDSLSLLGGGRLETSTAGGGDAGDIRVNSSNLRLFGASSGLFAQTTTAADAGNLTIQPQGNEQNVTVQLQEGAQVSASTSSSGRGGQLTIIAPESITLTGNGSIIAAETSGRGTGGSLTLQAGTLNVEDQAQVTVSSSGRGRAGSLFVNANEVFLNNQGSLRADTSGDGIGGNLRLQAGSVTIQDQAQVTVSSSGRGSAGFLLVDANEIYLDNQGSIQADTSGGGGDITLRSPFIVMRNGSNITTNATGTSIAGGNIAIGTRFLLTVPNENSNISANSDDFRGGNVSIDAVALYGIAPSSTATPLSSITATGATTDLSGTIDVTTAGVDPAAGLVALPTEFGDASGLIAQECAASEGNSFIVSGRGGMPPTPEQQLDDDARWQDRRRLIVSEQAAEATGNHPQSLEEGVDASRSIAETPLLEATGWTATPTGEVVLVASTPNAPLHQPAICSRQ